MVVAREAPPVAGQAALDNPFMQKYPWRGAFAEFNGHGRCSSGYPGFKDVLNIWKTQMIGPEDLSSHQGWNFF